MSSILVADDSRLTRNILNGILTAGGHKVLEAVNGREAVEMALSHRPDCIILDILMPEMDGFEVLGALKEKGLAIPVIVHSADIQKTTRKKCFELGAFNFINKPPEEDKLLSAIQEVLDSKKGTDK